MSAMPELNLEADYPVTAPPRANSDLRVRAQYRRPLATGDFPIVDVVIPHERLSLAGADLDPPPRSIHP